MKKLRKCCKCEKIKDLNLFSKNKGVLGGYNYMCFECRRVESKEYWYKIKGTEQAKEYAKKKYLMMKNNSKKHVKLIARATAKNAVVWGKIKKQPCEKCNNEDSQIHHED